MKNRILPIPAFFNAANAASFAYSPNQGVVRSAAQEYLRQYGVKPVKPTDFKVELAIIDGQKDFCFPEGSLYVAGRSGQGAIDDNARTAEFIYRNLETITGITTTLDTHFAFQIFFPSFWKTSDGAPVQPHTVISADEVEAGKYVPDMRVMASLPELGGSYGWLCKQVLHYCRELEKGGKLKLYIWPEHCILGSDGHPLAGVLHEARMFHSFVRGVQSLCEIKGGNPLTENYSVFSPEVLTRFDGPVLAQKNHALIQRLVKNDRLIFLGQAASHCVASSIRDFLGAIAHDPALVRKVYVVENCMSAVTVPDGKGGFILDYTDTAQAALDEFRDAGMHVVKSTDPIETWPDFFNTGALANA
jgi:nicotinamidase-related amidase